MNEVPETDSGLIIAHKSFFFLTFLERPNIENYEHWKKRRIGWTNKITYLLLFYINKYIQRIGVTLAQTKKKKLERLKAPKPNSGAGVIIQSYVTSYINQNMYLTYNRAISVITLN